MIYRAILDGTVMDEPQGWESITTTMKRDYNIKGIVVTQDGKFNFQGSGYDYLHTLMLDSSGTSKVDVRIDRSDDDGQTFIQDYVGILFIADCEFEEGSRSVSCKIQDDSYYARINNNKSIGVLLYGSRSKNNVDIDPCTLYHIKYFTVTTGTYIAQTLNGGYEGAAFKSYDVLRYMIEWMTDANIGFTSDIFDTDGLYENYFITHGRAIQLYNQSLGCPGDCPPQCTQAVWEDNWEKISWETILKEYSNRFNLWWTIDYSTGSPVFRIENEQYFRGRDTVAYAFDVNTIKTKINYALFYAKVKFGQGQMFEEAGTNFPETIDFVGWKDEEFQLLGESNIDTTLDLTTSWLTSSNNIEQLLTNGVLADQQYDRSIYMIECTPDSGTNYFAVKSDFLDTGYFYYNPSLTNASISNRFFGSVPQSIATYLGAGNDEFHATLTYLIPLTVPTVPIEFDDDISTVNGNFDTSGNYDSSTFEYIAPSGGVFTFNVDLFLHFVPIVGTTIAFGIYIDRYDSGGVSGGTLLTSTLAYYNYLLQGPSRQVTGSSTVMANAGDKLCVRVDWINALNVSVHPNSSFSCTKSTTGGGVYATYDYNDFPAFIHEFDYPLKNTDYKTIINNNGELMEFKMNGQQIRKGWFDLVKFTPSTGITSFQLSSTKNIN
jgi:hypothetical protein